MFEYDEGKTNFFAFKSDFIFAKKRHSTFLSSLFYHLRAREIYEGKFVCEWAKWAEKRPFPSPSFASFSRVIRFTTMSLCVHVLAREEKGLSEYIHTEASFIEYVVSIGVCRGRRWIMHAWLSLSLLHTKSQVWSERAIFDYCNQLVKAAKTPTTTISLFVSLSWIVFSFSIFAWNPRGFILISQTTCSSRCFCLLGSLLCILIEHPFLPPAQQPTDTNRCQPNTQARNSEQQTQTLAASLIWASDYEEEEGSRRKWDLRCGICKHSYCTYTGNPFSYVRRRAAIRRTTECVCYSMFK